MLPPTIEIIEHELRSTAPREVFAILQLSNVDDSNEVDEWYRVVRSIPDEGGERYDHNHAERILADCINRLIGEWIRDHRNPPILPTTSTITIKYSPCPECSRTHLKHIVNAFKSRGIKNNYLYYLDRYRGLAQQDVLDGITEAITLFAEVDEYSNRRSEWKFRRNRFWEQMGYDYPPGGGRGRPR